MPDPLLFGWKTCQSQETVQHIMPIIVVLHYYVHINEIVKLNTKSLLLELHLGTIPNQNILKINHILERIQFKCLVQAHFYGVKVRYERRREEGQTRQLINGA